MHSDQMPMSLCQSRRFTTNPYPPSVRLSELGWVEIPNLCPEWCSGFEPDLYISTTQYIGRKLCLSMGSIFSP